MCITIALGACNTAKKTQKAINSGNYDGAINIALNKLRDNKTKKGNQEYIVMLEEAFIKAVSRDVNHIKFLEKDGNPENFEAIYETYLGLRNRQERIKPLLPLYIVDKNRNAKFTFKDYTNQIINYKNKTSEYLYNKASELLENGITKLDFRKAYDDFAYLQKINPNYKDVETKLNIAHNKGTNYVIVSMYNDSNMVIPEALEADLLSFNSYGINDFWTEYHVNPLQEVSYDYSMDVAFTAINISPEQIKERQIIKEKQIKDGETPALDENGNKLKDSLGNYIMVDKFKTIRCTFYEFNQYKAVDVVGQVTFTDLQNNQPINSYPLASGFEFNHVFATYDGDKRALDDAMLSLINVRQVPFPTHEEMIFNAAEDLKQKLKAILRKQRF